MSKFVPYLLALGLSICASSAFALPTLSIDLDPGTPGVQSTATVTSGEMFSADIVIAGVDLFSPLNGFELDVSFDSSVVSATAVASGGFLLPPSLVVQSLITATEVEFAEVTLFPAGASGSGVLATISFDAVGSGTSLLDLHAVILAAPFGIPIFTAAINDATVTAVPEPGTALTLISGLIAFGGFVRRSARR